MAADCHSFGSGDLRGSFSVERGVEQPIALEDRMLSRSITGVASCYGISDDPTWTGPTAGAVRIVPHTRCSTAARGIERNRLAAHSRQPLPRRKRRPRGIFQPIAL
jgi:hypothetical protein